MLDTLITRRDFVLGCASLVALLPTGIFAKGGFFGQSAGTHLNAQLAAECKVISDYWKTSFPLSPETYVKKAFSTSEATSYNAVITQDFRKNNVVVIGGLVLSKTEAALISVYSNVLESDVGLT